MDAERIKETRVDWNSIRQIRRMLRWSLIDLFPILRRRARVFVLWFGNEKGHWTVRYRLRWLLRPNHMCLCVISKGFDLEKNPVDLN